MEHRISKMPASQRRNFEIAAPMTSFVSRKTMTFKFEKAKPAARQQILRHADDVHKFVKERSRWESQGPVRKAGSATERVPSAVSKETAPSAKRKGLKMRPSEPMGSAPEERARGSEAPGSDRESSRTSYKKQMATKISSRKGGQNQPDKVKVRTSPVVGKEGGGSFRKKPPSQPAEEQKNRR
jgi:hypothetical protein